MVEDAESALARTETAWKEWSGRCTYDGPYRDAVLTSLIALKAMTVEETGALVAAPTTSLPEELGGVRNWDYRYCWLRDSVLALEAFLATGYTEEALAFRDFLLRAGTGDPAAIQIMYGIGGERRLTEFELPHLPGYEGSAPVRVGNAASEQFQLDVYGEVVGRARRRRRCRGGGRRAALAPLARRGRISRDDLAATRRRDLGGARAPAPLHLLEGHGLGGLRPRRAGRRAVRAGGPDRPLEGGSRRDPRRGVREGLRPGAQHLHPVLRLEGARRQRPQHSAGRLPSRHRRAGFRHHRCGLRRARSRRVRLALLDRRKTDDGLPGDEGQFLACSFWLVRRTTARNGRGRRGPAHCSSACSASPNDLGLLAEEYDQSPTNGRSGTSRRRSAT